MKNVVELTVALIYSGTLLFGGGYGIKTIHDEVKRAALTKVSKGLGSSEALANALTGEKLGF